MKKNIEWINQARGIGMFLVVFGHAMHDSFNIFSELAVQV